MTHRVLPLFLLAAIPVAPQTSTPPAFEVASIKPAQPGDRMGNFPTPDTLTIGNRTLRQIIMEVNGVKIFQVVGGPFWIDSEHFNIVAKAPTRSNMTEMMRM